MSWPWASDRLDPVVFYETSSNILDVTDMEVYS